MAKPNTGGREQWQAQDLAGKVAVVTGGTKGIGRAITLDLATRGSAILATYSSQASANSFEELKEKIESVYRAANVDAPKLVGVNADITDPSAPNVIITSLISHFEGKLDILVFNAAVMSLARMGDGAMDDAFLDRFMVGNLKFPIMLMDRLVAQERVRPGSRVIAISSEAVRAKRPAGGSAYTATKAGIEGLMRSWADELGKGPRMEGTTFNSVSVGLTKTDAWNRIPPEVREKFEEADAKEVTVGNRVGEPEDVADVVGMLVSEKARWISGSVVDATGGKAKVF